MKVILTSNEKWGEIWFSKHHYAYELSRLGHLVYFVDPPEKWNLRSIISLRTSVAKISETLYIIRYSNTFPLRLFPSVFLFLNDLINSWKIKKITDEVGVWWQFDPFRFVNIFFYKKAKRIYHVVDPYFHITTDLKIASKADLIILISDYYASRYHGLKYKVIPHGVGSREFSTDLDKYKKVHSEIGSEYLLFVGTLNKDVNYRLLKRLTEINVKIVLIGPKTSITDEQNRILADVIRHANVKHIPKVSAEHLKYYVMNAQLCIVPYTFDKTENIHRTPLKIISYILQLKPIVSTIEYDLLNFQTNLFYFPKSEKDFVDSIQRIINTRQDLIGIQWIFQYLLKNRYTSIINEILREVSLAANTDGCYKEGKVFEEST